MSPCASVESAGQIGFEHDRNAAGQAYLPAVGVSAQHQVMTYVVVPISAAPSRPPPGISKITKDLVAMLGFGLIVAFAVHRASL